MNTKIIRGVVVVVLSIAAEEKEEILTEFDALGTVPTDGLYSFNPLAQNGGVTGIARGLG